MNFHVLFQMLHCDHKSFPVESILMTGDDSKRSESLRCSSCVLFVVSAIITIEHQDSQCGRGLKAGTF
jgi:hypothetical protein